MRAGVSPRTAQRAAIVTGFLALAVLAGNGAVIWLLQVPASAGSPPAASLWLVGLAGAPVTGMLIAARRPRNAYGWLLLSFGVTSGLLELTELVALALLEAGSASALSVVGALASQTLWGATIGHLPLLLLLFPDGRLPSVRWRWLSRAVVTLTVGGSLVALFLPGDLGVVPLPNPIAAQGAWATAVNVVLGTCVVGVFVAMFPAAASLFVRRRGATQQQRLQLRWFSYAAAVLAVALLVAGIGGIDSEIVSNALIMVGLLGLYAAIAVAVLRYRLYDIDRIVSRTLAYAGVTLVVGAVYLISVTLLTTLTARLAGESPLAVAAATLLAAAVFRPTQRRVQSTVDRRFNRAHYDAANTVAVYRERLRDEIDLGSIAGGLQGTVVSTLQPRATALWLHTPGRHS